jgi:methylenetetrahydrofolate reductase (NADH)
MSLRQAFGAGRFVVTAELGPPVDPDPELVREKARALVGLVDAVNVTDNQVATVKVSPLAAAVLTMAEGLETVLQLTTRDRNLLALQSELLGAWALGVRAVLALTGDPLAVGEYGSLATAVSDRDSLGLTRLIRELNEGRLAAGETLGVTPDFLILGAANPLRDSAERLEQKLEAGVRCFQTNIVYDVDRFEEWFEPIRAAGIPERAPFLVGVTPPRSSRVLRHMHDNIPGVEVDDATFGRMEGLDGEDAKAAGVEIAARIVERLAETEGVAGVHLMAPGWEAEAIPNIVRHRDSNGAIRSTSQASDGAVRSSSESTSGPS